VLPEKNDLPAGYARRRPLPAVVGQFHALLVGALTHVVTDRNSARWL
jgi:hypothetical protein